MPRKQSKLYAVTILLLSQTLISFEGRAQAIDSELTSDFLAEFRAELESASLAQDELGFESSSANPTLEVGNTPIGEFVPFLGQEVERVSIIRNGEKVDVFWQELSPDEWRRVLQDQFIQTTIFDKQVGLTLAGGAGNAGLGKGTYRLTYHNFRTKIYPCSASNPAAGSLVVGVGLRILIDAEFKKRSLSIGFSSLALSANGNRVSGSIQADIVGLATSQTLGQVVGAASGSITYDSLIEASKAYAVAGQAIEGFSELSNPRVIGYIDLLEEGSCLAALGTGIGQ